MSFPEQDHEMRSAEDRENEPESAEQMPNLPPPPLVPVGPLTDEALSDGAESPEHTDDEAP